MQSFRTLEQLLRGVKGKVVRACVSLLVSSFIHKMNTAEFKSATFPNAGPRHLLDDSVMEPHVPSWGQAESSTLSSGISIGTACQRALHRALGFAQSFQRRWVRVGPAAEPFYFRLQQI